MEEGKREGEMDNETRLIGRRSILRKKTEKQIIDLKFFFSSSIPLK